MAKNRNKSKSPKREVNPSPEKSPKVAGAVQDSTSIQGQKIKWSFHVLDMDGPFGWSNCSLSNFGKLKSSLSNFETMIWAEIVSSRHHAIAIDNLSKSAKKRLSEIKLDDIDEIFSLAVGSRERIIGIRDRDIFKFLWWDPKHQVCPSKTKHT